MKNYPEGKKFINPSYQAFSKERVPKNNFLISQPKHMLWVLKKNRLNETIVLSTQNLS